MGENVPPFTTFETEATHMSIELAVEVPVLIATVTIDP